jgi:hypothetical protein
MSDPETRRVVSWVTLAGTAVATLVMAVWGFQAFTAPIDDGGDQASSPTDEVSCAPGQEVTVKYLRRREVTVSVYNAGKKAGRAGDTMDRLQRAGFQVGAIGNAPEGTRVARVEVRAAKADDPAARLVALAFGRDVPVTVSTSDLGPGVDVIIGDRFKRLDGAAPARVELDQPTVTCAS